MRTALLFTLIALMAGAVSIAAPSEHTVSIEDLMQAPERGSVDSLAAAIVSARAATLQRAGHKTHRTVAIEKNAWQAVATAKRSWKSVRALDFIDRADAKRCRASALARSAIMLTTDARRTFLHGTRDGCTALLEALASSSR